jgi:very-short-patch-repair endonuclease
MNEIEQHFFDSFLRFGRSGQVIRDDFCDYDCQVTTTINPTLGMGLSLSIFNCKQDRSWNGFVIPYPQHKFGPYTVDFFIGGNIEESRPELIIEIDGHQFHEKTKAQAEHDKKRDRFLVGRGFSILRFTGSEIYRDSDSCVKESILCVINRYFLT